MHINLPEKKRIYWMLFIQQTFSLVTELKRSLYLNYFCI